MTPHFAIHDGFASYRGPSADNVAHAHAAFQIAIAPEGEVTMHDGAREIRGPALVVPPMVRHRMFAMPSLLNYFIDPHCAFADRLRERCVPVAITVAPELRSLSDDDIRAAGARPSALLDERLQSAMNEAGESSLPELASRVGLSPQRLRALAREQLGMPLSRWRIWKRLRKATDAMREGRALIDAAVEGGFSDQAHFTRQMREMMGVAPSALLPLLRPVRDVDRH